MNIAGGQSRRDEYESEKTKQGNSNLERRTLPYILLLDEGEYGWKAEDGRQRAEDRGRKTEGGRQRAEDRGRKTVD